ncbi:MAG: CDP-diacylglycerol--glycerol-3-phosphate 3-phosphatidyltransferase [Pseudomonadota bacterium]
MIWTIPNILTIARILAAPCIALVFLVFDRPLADWLALGLFIGAALTDFLDGWLARKLGQISAIGKMLDPIADKAMVVIALALILVLHSKSLGGAGTTSHPFPSAIFTVPVVIILLREVLVSGLREYLGQVKLDVTGLAKWKTTAQMVAIALLLAVWPLFESDLRNIGLDGEHARGHLARIPNIIFLVGVITLWIAALLTLITGWDYFRKGLAYIREREDQ